MKRPCFRCCSLVSYRPLPNAKPVAGKKAGKNKLVLSSVSDLQTSNTIYSGGAKAWNSENERIFKRNNFFSLSFVLVSCFLFLNFARRESYVFPITGNTKVNGCWIFRLCAVSFRAKHLATSWRIDRDFCNSRKVFTSEMSKMICCDLAMGGRAEILKVCLYFRVWYAVGAKIVRWRYPQVPVLLHNKRPCSTLYTVLPLSHRYTYDFPPEFAG